MYKIFLGAEEDNINSSSSRCPQKLEIASPLDEDQVVGETSYKHFRGGKRWEKSSLIISSRKFDFRIRLHFAKNPVYPELTLIKFFIHFSSRMGV
jgi:hypothetical protein